MVTRGKEQLIRITQGKMGLGSYLQRGSLLTKYYSEGERKKRTNPFSKDKE
jgi:hypothetical protein